ncbi:galactosyltransferase, partial [Campylobacter coli]|nr:galactosyltransferase [Campylobacter coli]
MIINSKNIFGILFMPICIISTILSYRQEQKLYQEKIKKDPSLKLPPLESYPDYKEALKEKECLTYKLGEALIKANKTWYKGGYVKLLFKIRKLQGS